MDLGRFSGLGLLIMVGLADGPKHGYSLMDEIERLRGDRPGPGTLYGAIARLEDRGLIEGLPEHDRRRPYRLTEAGREVLVAELARLERVLVAGTARLGT
ncbi:MAG: PadR family transcriptional regulator [Actinomycetota bacterium]